MDKVRAREVGLFHSSGPTGPLNAITDVPGVSVGYTTKIAGDGPLKVGAGPVRTGVTVILPTEDPAYRSRPTAGIYRLNGNGELTGSHWIDESGLLTSPIGLTNTHSVGVVRDALVAYECTQRVGEDDWWSLPVVGETWDGILNDINGQHVTADDLFAAISSATSGPIAEGNVGSGTGMMCHGFKGGIGTASRVIESADGPYTLGVLVQANQGMRNRLTIDGMPIGREIPDSEVPVPGGSGPEGMGSIITIVATDAPLSGTNCRSVAARTALGIGRVGGTGEFWSGDLSLAFSTGNADADHDSSGQTTLRAVDAATLVKTYDATVDAVEEAIVNALFAGETMTGRDGNTVCELPIKRVVDLMPRFGLA